MTPSPASPRALWRSMAAMFLVALIVRGLYVLAFRASPYFDHPLVDAAWHDEWAAAWARGEWSMDGKAFFRAPLYPYWLSLLYRVFGHDVLAVRLVQAALGASTAAALTGLGSRLFGARAGLWAGALAAMYGPLVYFDGELLIPNLLLALLAWGAFLASGGGWASLLGAAACLGLAATARPNALALLPLLAIVAVVRAPGALRAARVFRGAVAIAVALVPALTVTALNARESGAFVFISSQGGVNFYAGNHARATGRSVQIPEIDRLMNWQEFLEKSESIPALELGRPLNGAETSRYWADKGLAWIREHPGAALALTARKAYYLLNAFEVPNNRDLYVYQPWPLRPLLWKIPALAFPWGIVFPLAAAGFVLALRDPRLRRGAAILGAWFLLYGISLLPFFICARFRMAMVLPMVLLAGHALANPGMLRGRRALVAFGAAFLLANSAFLGARQQNLAEEQTKYAATLLEAGEMELGTALLKEAVAQQPNQVAPNYLLADVYLETGDFARALPYFEKVVLLRPDDLRARFSLGASLLGLERWEAAAIEFETIVRADKFNAAAWGNLGVANEELGDTTRAEAAYREAIALVPAELAYLRLTDIYLVRGNFDEAAHLLGDAVVRAPESFPLRYQFAVALARQGRYEQALAAVDAALALDPRDRRANELKRWIEGRIAAE